LKERILTLTNENRLLKADLESRFDQTSFEAKRKIDDEARQRKQVEA